MGLLDIVGGMLGGQAGRAGAGGSQAELLNMILGMLANGGQGGGQRGGQGGGLASLVEQFQAAGLGEQVNSWISSGQNLPVSPGQLEGALGSNQMSQMAERMGLSTGDLSAQMSQMLPQVVDHFTPDGRMPEGGLGNLGDLLGSLLRR
ncbi:MAG TPA: YidB family protein [Rubrivivax sp.]|nr:YidB family protein [Rubrivivax sp.]